VQMGTVYTPANVPAGPSPSIVHFAASAGVIMKGQHTTLSWNATWNSSIPGYNIIFCGGGPGSGNSLVVAHRDDLQAVLYQRIWPYYCGR
jgi:hypothetical protein